MIRTIARFLLEGPDRMHGGGWPHGSRSLQKATCKSVRFDPVFFDIFMPAVNRFGNMRPIGNLQAATSGGPAPVNSRAARACPALAARPRAERGPHSPFMPAPFATQTADGLAADGLTADRLAVTMKPSMPLPGRNVVSCC
jgi:hypothetical protein